MRIRLRGLIGAMLLLAGIVQGTSQAWAEPLRIGSKAFTESYILAEITAQLLENRGFDVQRKPGLGGTLIAFEALREGAIDLYPEYTGTLTETVLQRRGLPPQELAAALAAMDLAMPVKLGFDNSYAIAIAAPVAQAAGLRAISQLADHPELALSFSHEFLNRDDGWPALRAAYDLPHRPGGIEHALAYRAVAAGRLDGTDAYTTDGELEVYDLTLLRDDRNFFPAYQAGLLARRDLPDDVHAVLALLEGRIDEATMRSLNMRAANEGESPAAVAADFLRSAGLVAKPSHRAQSRASRILGYTGVHLKLTGLALSLACLVAIPLALVLAPFPPVARGFLYATGLIQTIPALALLALMIPLAGLGQLPAVMALFLYSLLPIVRNTLTGLFGVDPLLKQVATGMGLTRRQQLLRVELPLAVPTILAGIKTAAVISIGTATLAAFVGAGGLGEPIITGLTLNDHRLILEGAIPAALLAVAVELLFELLERRVMPPHLRN